MIGNITRWSAFPAALIVLMCLLCLAVSWLLLLSKDFAKEFGDLRESQPTYKRILKQITVGGVIIWAVAGAAVDVSHLVH